MLYFFLQVIMMKWPVCVSVTGNNQTMIHTCDNQAVTLIPVVFICASVF